MSASGLYPDDSGSTPDLPTNCGCTPGSPENGWHEHRCKACVEAELDVWRKLMKDFDKHYRL